MTPASAFVAALWLAASTATAQEPAVEVEPAADVEPAVEAEPAPAVAPADAPPTGDVAPAPDASAAKAGQTDPDLADVTERLLGDAPVLPTTGTDRSSEPLLLPDTPSWMWPVGLLMLAAIVALRWQTQRAPDPAARMRVIQRMMLGREGHLALVEVGEDDDRRRLLIGYGSGAPRLVAELDVPEVATASPRPEATSAVPAAQRWQRALSRLGVSAPQSTPARSSKARPAAPERSAGGASPSPQPGNRSAARLRPRRSLVEEVLAERGPSRGAGEEPTEVVRAPTSASPPVVSEEDAGEDQESKETYTFRGLIG